MAWRQLFKWNAPGDDFCGYVNTLEEAEALVQSFEVETHSRFHRMRGNLDFGKRGMCFPKCN